jgi:hypothetical protein
VGEDNVFSIDFNSFGEKINTAFEPQGLLIVLFLNRLGLSFPIE